MFLTHNDVVHALVPLVLLLQGTHIGRDTPQSNTQLDLHNVTFATNIKISNDSFSNPKSELVLVHKKSITRLHSRLMRGGIMM